MFKLFSMKINLLFKIDTIIITLLIHGIKCFFDTYIRKQIYKIYHMFLWISLYSSRYMDIPISFNLSNNLYLIDNMINIAKKVVYVRSDILNFHRKILDIWIFYPEKYYYHVLHRKIHDVVHVQFVFDENKP